MIGLAIRAIAILAALAALAYAWHRFTEHYREQGRIEVRAEWDADKAARQEFNSKIIVGLSNDLMKEKDDHAKAVAHLDHFFAVLENASAAVHRGGGIAIPDDVVGVLRAGTDQANGDKGATPAAGAGGTAEAAAIPAAQVYDEVEVAQWGIGVDKAYAKTVELLRACYHREMRYWTAITTGENP